MSRRCRARWGGHGWYLALLVACEPPGRTAPATADPRALEPDDTDDGETAPPPVAEPASRASPDRPPAAVVSLDDDRALRTLRDRVPTGWRVLAEEDRVVVERIEVVWVMSENRVNALLDTDSAAATAARVMKDGQQVHSRIVYRAEEGWSPERIRSTRADNARIHEELAALADVHHVRHLVDAASRRKHNDPRVGASPAELPRIELYLRERAQLEGHLRHLPAFLGERYALFGPEHEGWSDASHLVHPLAVAEESYRVDREVRSLLEASTIAIE